MKMTGRKATVFIALNIIFTVFFIMLIFLAKDALNIIGSVIIGAMVLISIAFIGGNTYDKFIKSKYYRDELK